MLNHRCAVCKRERLHDGGFWMLGFTNPLGYTLAKWDDKIVGDAHVDPLCSPHCGAVWAGRGAEKLVEKPMPSKEYTASRL